MAGSTLSLPLAAATTRVSTSAIRCPRMSSLRSVSAAIAATALLSVTVQAAEGPAQDPDTQSASLSDPYRQVDNFLKMPAGRHMGSTSAIATDRDGNIWVAERCGANNCAGSDLDPIVEFDARGNFIKAFGRGMLLFPHGFFIDNANHIWV